MSELCLFLFSVLLSLRLSSRACYPPACLWNRPISENTYRLDPNLFRLVSFFAPARLVICILINPYAPFLFLPCVCLSVYYLSPSSSPASTDRALHPSSRYPLSTSTTPKCLTTPHTHAPRPRVDTVIVDFFFFPCFLSFFWYWSRTYTYLLIAVFYRMYSCCCCDPHP